MHKRPSASLWLDNRYLKKDNTFPIKIRITSNGNRTYYPTNIALTKEDFERAISLKPGSKLKEIHIRLLALEMQANRIIDTIIIQNSEDFSIEKFEALLNPANKVTSDVYRIFTNKIAELEKTGQISTAAGYQAAHNSLKGYHNYLKFSQVDKNFLLGYEKAMLEAGKSYSTVGIYLRYLRTIFNIALDQGLIEKKQYPFGRNRYSIPESANAKKALDRTDIIKLLQYKTFKNHWEEYAKDMWTLSLVCQGINLKDIANLKFKNIKDDKIVFIREKTKRKLGGSKLPVIVYLDNVAKDIIDKWKTNNQRPDQYVFMIFDQEKTAKQNIKSLQQHNKMINKYIRRIAISAGVSCDVTFYTARHSFATALKRQGRSIEEIQEFLGHSDKKTTEKYLASFGDEHKRNIMKTFNASLKNK